MIVGIDHIEIVVRDIDEMAELFGKIGFEEIRRTDHHGKAVEMRVPGPDGIVIEFHTGHATEPPGLNHIAFRVDDAAETVAQMRSVGVELADAHIAKNSGRLISTFRDPMHMRWQISE